MLALTGSHSGCAVICSGMLAGTEADRQCFGAHAENTAERCGWCRPSQACRPYGRSPFCWRTHGSPRPALCALFGCVLPRPWAYESRPVCLPERWYSDQGFGMSKAAAWDFGERPVAPPRHRFHFYHTDSRGHQSFCLRRTGAGRRHPAPCRVRRPRALQSAVSSDHARTRAMRQWQEGTPAKPAWPKRAGAPAFSEGRPRQTRSCETCPRTRPAC